MRRPANGFPRKRHLAVAAVLGAALAVLPALASSAGPTIEALDTGPYSHAWSPTHVSVIAGSAVTFANHTTTSHGVEWIGANKPTCDASVPVGTTAAASGTEWSGNCTFAQAGTYTFYCTVHGPEMTGTVTVTAEGTTTTTTTTPGTGTTTPTTTTPAPTGSSDGSPLAGSTAKALRLAVSQRGGAVRGSLNLSDAAAGRRLEVDLLASRASLSGAGHARVRVGRLVRDTLHAGTLSFSVKLNARARRALRRHHRLALTVRISFSAGQGEPLRILRSVVERSR